MNLKLIGAIAAVGFVLFLVWCGYDYGYNKAKSGQISTYQTQITQLEAKLKTALESERNSYAKQEQLEADYLSRLQELKQHEMHTIDQYRAHAISLRDSLKPKQCANVSDTTSSASNSDANTTGGLLDTDVEFLIRFAAKADAVAEQLAAAQQTIINDRELCNAIQQ